MGGPITTHTLIAGVDVGEVRAVARNLDQGRGVVTTFFRAADALDALAAIPDVNLVVVGGFRLPHSQALPAQLLLSPPRRPARLLLVNPRSSPQLGPWMQELARSGLNAQLVQLIEHREARRVLGDLLGFPPMAERHEASTSSVGLHPRCTPSDRDTVALMCSLWASRRSGRLRLLSSSRVGELVGGHPVDEAARALLVQGMYAGGVEFEDRPARPGVRGLPLAEDLWEAGRRLGDPEDVLGRLGEVLYERPSARRLRELPLAAPIVRLLGVPRERAALLALCRSADVTPQRIAAPLASLVAMEFFGFRQSVTAARHRRTGAPRPVASRIASTRPVSQVSRATPPRDTPKAPERRGQVHSRGPFVERFHGGSPSTESLQPAPTTVEATSSKPLGSEIRLPERDLSGSVEALRDLARKAEARRKRERSQASNPPSSARRLKKKRRTVARSERSAARSTEAQGEHVTALARRLEKDWALLEHAEDCVVLGIPKGAPVELVHRATRRLRRRYERVSSDHQYSLELRELALRIQRRIEHAGRDLEAGRGQSGVPMSDHTMMFKQGKRALDQRDYAAACRWFRAARKLRPRSAEYTGYLGWAIYNATSLDAGRRTAKALELLQLAEFSADPIPELQLFLATIEANEGMPSDALRRVRWVLGQRPDWQEAEVLLRRVEQGMLNG